jgi:hypothetical protein
VPDQIPPKHNDGPKGPPPPPPGIPPHIIHEMMDLNRRVGRLEGILEEMHLKHLHCECPECKKEP